MNNSTYLAQVNILKETKSLVNSTTMQNAIEYNNRIASMVSPFAEMKRQMNEIYQPIQNMAGAYSAVQTMASRLDEYNAINSQVVEILNKFNSIREMCQINFSHNEELIQIINNMTALRLNITHFPNMHAAMGTISQYKNLYDTLASVSDVFYDEVLADTEYDKNDILDSVEEFVEFVDSLEDVDALEENIETNENIAEVMDRKIKEFYAKHPVCFILFQIITILLYLGDATSTCKETYIPMIQETITRMEGNEDIYFTKTNVARVYEQPDHHSKVVGKLFYSEGMQKIKDINMWIKVKFTDKDGNECTGWVAKRNLIDYQTWKYNSDSLYTMGN